MRPPVPASPLRATAASCATVCAILICIAQRHVHIVLTEPTTYSHLFQHKCGMLLVACATWFLSEMASLAYPLRKNT